MLRIRRTISLSIATPKAKAICWAMRGEPQVGFRRFISTTAPMSSFSGPFGPGRRPRFDENNMRYLRFHNLLRKRKYRMLFSSKRGRRPGPKGPEKELIGAVVEMKRRNPTWGSPRIAQQIALAFGVAIDKDIVRRILSIHYRPDSGSQGPSWLTFLGHTKDSLWSCDLFRCKSATLRTHWVLVVMDHFTRRIIGFGVHRGGVDGVALCRMFQRAIRGQRLPKYLSSDHDPLFKFHQWQANLGVLEVREIKTVPYVPLSHPFVERLIGTVRREYLDRIPFWTTADLETKLLDFQHYFNAHRTHAGLEGRLPEPRVDGPVSPIDFGSYRWRRHCRGLYQTPIAACFINSPWTPLW